MTTLAPLAGAHMVRNTQPNPTVLTWGSANKDYLMWEGMGDPSGNDILEVTEDIIGLPQFRKMMKRGLFEIVEDETEIAESEEKQKEQWEKTRKGAHEEESSVLEHPEDKSFDVLTCIGPSDNPASALKCDAVISMKETDLKENPPLCARHKSLRNQYIPTDSTDETGKTSTVWSRVTISQR